MGCLKDIVEITGTDVRKATAQATRTAYTAQVAAIGLTLPLVVGGPPSLSQEQVRRPDENLPAQSQGNAEPMRSRMVATTSAVSFSISGESVLREGGSTYIVREISLEENDRLEAA